MQKCTAQEAYRILCQYSQKTPELIVSISSFIFQNIDNRKEENVKNRLNNTYSVLLSKCIKTHDMASSLQRTEQATNKPLFVQYYG